MNSLEDQIIEEAAYIWLNERDDQPCSIRRARLRQMCIELSGLQTKPFILTENLVRQSYSPRWPDRKMLAANDRTLDPDEAELLTSQP